MIFLILASAKEKLITSISSFALHILLKDLLLSSKAVFFSQLQISSNLNNC